MSGGPGPRSLKVLSSELQSSLYCPFLSSLSRVQGFPVAPLTGAATGVPRGSPSRAPQPLSLAAGGSYPRNRCTLDALCTHFCSTVNRLHPGSHFAVCPVGWSSAVRGSFDLTWTPSLQTRWKACSCSLNKCRNWAMSKVLASAWTV